MTEVGVFEKSSVPPLDGRTEFSLHGWDSERARGIEPRWCSTPADDDQGRAEFLRGARAYGLELGQPGKFGQLKPQQLLIADVLNAGHSRAVVEIPRRASKTTTIFMLLLGRCLSRPGYQVTFSAQTGVAGSRRLREWKQRLDAVQPADDQDLPPWLRGKGRTTKRQDRQVALFGEVLDEGTVGPQRRGFRILLGEVGKGIYFENGSTFLVLSPDPGAYRGEAADVSWIDEAQEVDPEVGDDLLAAIKPLQDTKPGSSIVLSGTAGEARVGPFWTHLDRLRSGDPAIGGLDYAAPEDTPWEVIEDETLAMALLDATHPGVGTLTTSDKMLDNYRDMGKPQWAREYLSLWPETFGSVVIDAASWSAAALAAKPKRPERVAFGVDIRPGGASSAIVAAWRNPRGVAYVEVVDHRSGTKWLPERMQELTRRYRGSTIAFDDIAEGKATATEADRLSPKPRLKLQTYRDTAAGCVQILRDLDRGTLRHADQVGLNAAVASAGRRETRTDQGVWLWTPVEQAADITCLVAATRALRNWDQHFARGGTSLGVIS